MMKKLVIALVSIMLLMPSAIVHAGSHGSGYIPAFNHFFASSQTHGSAGIILSNISSEEITCTVRIYDHDGNDRSTYGLIGVYTGEYGSYTPQFVSSTPTFTIPAKGTRIINYLLGTPYNMMGHVIIEWESSSNDIGQALLGGVITVRKQAGVYSHSTYPINDGKPF